MSELAAVLIGNVEKLMYALLSQRVKSVSYPVEKEIEKNSVNYVNVVDESLS